MCADPQIFGNHGAPCARGNDGRTDDRVLDVTARHVIAFGERVEIDADQAGGGGQELTPQLLALGDLRLGEPDAEVEPALQRGIDRGLGVRGQHRDPIERLHALEDVVDLEVREPILRALELGALAEQRVGLVEQEHRVRVVGLVKDPAEIFLGLADVLRDDRGEIDPYELEAELRGHDRSRHGLAGARLPGVQASDTARDAEVALEAPALEDLRALLDHRDHVAQRIDDIVGQHELGHQRLARDHRPERAEAE